jgi:hypothetical protein
MFGPRGCWARCRSVCRLVARRCEARAIDDDDTVGRCRIRCIDQAEIGSWDSSLTGSLSVDAKNTQREGGYCHGLRNAGLAVDRDRYRCLALSFDAPALFHRARNYAVRLATALPPDIAACAAANLAIGTR